MSPFLENSSILQDFLIYLLLILEYSIKISSHCLVENTLEGCLTLDDMDEDEEDGDDDDSEDGSEESAAGSSDLEGPLVTPAIQVPVRQAGVEMVSYYNTGMTAAARLLRWQSPLDVPKDTVDYKFHTRF